MSEPLLDRLQQQVADRDAIDWNGMTPTVLLTRSHEERQDFEFLRLLDQIAVANADFQTLTFDADSDPQDGQARQHAGDDLTGTTWGRYRRDERVGRGGFGAVYRAWDPILRMPVAIKILHRRVGDEQLKQRLMREGQALAQVKHPNVVRVLNVEENEGRLGLVMEFLS